MRLPCDGPKSVGVFKLDGHATTYRRWTYESLANALTPYCAE
jgi:hypothetical protein